MFGKFLKKKEGKHTVKTESLFFVVVKEKRNRSLSFAIFVLSNAIYLFIEIIIITQA